MTLLENISGAVDILAKSIPVITNLNQLFQAMELPPDKIVDITRNHYNSIKERLTVALQAWKELVGSRATVEHLVRILLALQHKDSAEMIQNSAEALGPTSIPDSTSIIDLEESAALLRGTLTNNNASPPQDVLLPTQEQSTNPEEGQTSQIFRKVTTGISLLVIIIMTVLFACYHIIPIRVLDKYSSDRPEIVTRTENYPTTPSLSRQHKNECVALRKKGKMRCPINHEIPHQNLRIVTLNDNNHHDFCDAEHKGCFLGGNPDNDDFSSDQEFCPHNLVALEILSAIRRKRLTNFLDRYCLLGSLLFGKNASVEATPGTSYLSDKLNYPSLQSLSFEGTVNVSVILANLSDHVSFPCLVEINLSCVILMAEDITSLRNLVASSGSLRRINCQDNNFCENLLDVNNGHELNRNFTRTIC